MQTSSRGAALAATLSPVTYGTSPVGKQPERTVALTDALLAGPFGQLDTSNTYADGESERAIGAAIARRGGLPSGVRVFTKVDADPVTDVFDGDRVRRSFAESLERLGLDRVPLLHLHDPFHLTVPQAMAPGGPVEALVRLRDEGAVDAIGIATGDVPQIAEFIRTDAFDAVLSHNEWTLVSHGADELWDLATERGMAVCNAAPFGGGILAGSTTRGSTSFAYREASVDLLRFVERLRTIAAQHEVDLAAAALQFSMREQRVHTTVVGVTSAERVEALPALVQAEIPDAFWHDVAALGTPPGRG